MVENIREVIDDNVSEEEKRKEIEKKLREYEDELGY